jgi:hypothetical protein
MIARSGGVAAGPARVFSREFVRGYVITMRPYLLFVSGIAGIVGTRCSWPRPSSCRTASARR